VGIVVDTARLDRYRLDKEQQYWTYCGLDSCITREVHDNLKKRLEPDTHAKTYNFTKAMLGPALSMMRRGFRLDHEQRRLVLEGDPNAEPDYVLFEAMAEKENEGPLNEEQRKASRVKAQWDAYLRREGLWKRRLILSGFGPGDKKRVDETALLQRIAKELTGKTINYEANGKVAELLYDVLDLPVQIGKTGTPTVDTEALEHLAESYPRAELICRIILRLRDIDKKIDVLTAEVDEDGRFRCSNNVVGTDTGRWSNSKSAYRTGGNLQNVTPELRKAFIPDDGYVLIYPDLEQAESRGVGYLSGDEAYIEACETFDLHTTVAHMVFGIPLDRDHADQPYYRHFSYRDLAKRGGHATNYLTTPMTLSRRLKIELLVASRFHLLYLGGETTLEKAERMGLLDMDIPLEREGKIVYVRGAFPGIARWHDDIRVQLQTEQQLVTPYMRKRTFWGRPTDAATLRKAVAHVPQSLIGDVLNTGLYRCWRSLEGSSFQLLAQVHDAFVAQVRREELDDLAPKVLEAMTIPVPVNGRTMIIPAELKYGPNWRDMKKWKPNAN